MNKDMPRVLYISYDGIMEPVGTSQVLSYLKRISEKGAGVCLVSFEKRHDLRDGAKRRHYRLEAERSKIEWRALTYHKRFKFLSVVLDAALGLINCIAIVSRKKITIIHARSYVAASIGWMTSLATGRPFIFDMRGFWADERVDADLLQKDSFLYKTAKMLERKFVNKAKKVVVLTRKAREELKSRFGGISEGKISVIPCCVDTSLFRFDEGARNEIRARYGAMNKLIFVHTGSLVGWYMLKEMMDFFKIVKGLEGRALFMLISPDAGCEAFTKIRKGAGLSRDNFILTSAPFEDVYRYLSAADVGLFFIKPTFSKKASCPIKFAEYLSCELPVICNSNIGDLDDIIKENKLGILVEDFNEKAYADSYRRCSELLNDKELKNRCRNAAERSFSIEDGVSSYLDVYRGISDNRRPER